MAVRRVREHSLRNLAVAEAKGEREGEEEPCHPQQDDLTSEIRPTRRPDV